MRHGSLFSGIGGIDLGFRWAGIETVWQVEKASFCRKVLEKNFPGAQRFSDVRDCGKHNLAVVDVISGGFPCQNISGEGDRKGLEQPSHVLNEDPIGSELPDDPGLLKPQAALPSVDTEGDRVLAEMEAAGYRCWPLILGAKEIGATHQRSRAWILCRRADTAGDGPAMAGVGVLSQEAAGALAGAIEGWNGRADELASGISRVEGDAYARVARDRDGLSRWLDRHRALGNAVVPQILILFGCFIQGCREAEGLLRIPNC